MGWSYETGYVVIKLTKGSVRQKMRGKSVTTNLAINSEECQAAGHDHGGAGRKARSCWNGASDEQISRNGMFVCSTSEKVVQNALDTSVDQKREKKCKDERNIPL